MNIRLDQFVCPLAFLTLILFEDVLSAEVPFPGSEKLGKSFAAMDSNADQLLSHDEFLANRRPREVLSRDFLLFDRDANGSLTLLEFASIPISSKGSTGGQFLILCARCWRK
jgi:Ca2+-binding EF-hand superfamily protein